MYEYDDCNWMVYAWPSLLDWIMGIGLGLPMALVFIACTIGCVVGAANSDNDPVERIVFAIGAVCCAVFGFAIVAMIVWFMFHDCALPPGIGE